MTKFAIRRRPNTETAIQTKPVIKNEQPPLSQEVKIVKLTADDMKDTADRKVFKSAKLTAEDMKDILDRKAKEKAEKAEEKRGSVIFSNSGALFVFAIGAADDVHVDTFALTEGDTDDFIQSLEELLAFFRGYQNTCYFDIETDDLPEPEEVK